MDAIKLELERKRKAREESFVGRKYVRRGEIEQKNLQQLREEERRELEQKAAKVRNQEVQKVNEDQPGVDQAAGKEKKVDSLDAEAEDSIDKLVLPRVEVIRRLRMLKQPITLFGEDDDTRLLRLKALMKAGVLNPENELMEGQRNDFLRDMTEMLKGEKAGHGELRKVKKKTKGKSNDQEGKDGGIGGTQEGGEGASSGDDGSDEDDDIDSKKLKANWEELCEEDKILVFFKRLLKEWKQELDERPEADKRSARGKSHLAVYKQCARYLEPMFMLCRKKQLFDDIKAAIMFMVKKCKDRDYLAAMDKYIKLAIGNSPWPIGVTMVGIHERSAREKIHTNSVAHIMNDETTRKYLQSVKRLMTLCQRRYPALPSKSVEFNSLANGSDLVTLLAEEQRIRPAAPGEERLRLTATAVE